MNDIRRLRVFLCHSSHDKPLVRDVYKLLSSEKWIIPWLDEASLRPGQDWRFEIENAINGTDVVIVFLSQSSVSKEGFVQKEIRYVLDKFDEKPAGTIYIVPIRVEECDVPKRLAELHWIDISIKNSEWYSPLLESLKLRAKDLGISIEKVDNDKDLLVDRYGRLLSDFNSLESEFLKTKRALEIREIEVKSILVQAHELANLDGQTFLPNRRRIIVELQEEVIQSGRNDKPLSALLFNLDTYKQIKDQYGRSIADEVLKRSVGEFIKVFRSPNILGRIADDDFLVVLPDSTLGAATELAERLCQNIRNTPLIEDENTFQITLSVGVAEYTPRDNNWENFFHRLDQALNIAVKRGRDQWATLGD